MPSGTRQVYVISDLHLGGDYPRDNREGARGFRQNTHVPELTQFVQQLTGKLKEGAPIELIINGDMVDFLAEKNATAPEWSPFNADAPTACRKLEAIAERDIGFFQAVGEFARSGGRLTLLIGNHDIELSLPAVRQTLEAILGLQGSEDYNLIHNGEAYTVGDALIDHGNRYDSWNVVNYDALRRVCSLMSRRQPVPAKYAFDAPAGSKLVCQVMNPIKEDYAFIDLLQPVQEAAVPLLLALEPGFRRNIAEVAKLALQASRHGLEAPALPSIGGDIRAEEVGVEAFGSDISARTLDTLETEAETLDPDLALRQVLKQTMGDQAGSFLREAAGGETRTGIGEDISAMETVERGLGLAKLLFGRKSETVDQRLPALLKALRALQNDKSFDLGVEAVASYVDSARELARGGFRYVLFGHTHLVKKVPLGNGVFYLNSGTWADLMQVPAEIIAGSDAAAMEKLREFVDGIAAGNLSRWIKFKPTYIRLELDAKGTVARADLYQYPSETPL